LLRNPQYSPIARLGKAACWQALESGRYTRRVEEQMEWSRREGIGGVPAFIFDGRFALEGAQSYDMFKSVTERILATRGDG
jgi:predicted DsbA family dithiol-disulfide isomerase